MYNNWEKFHEFDTKNPTFSSSLLDKINKSLKNSPKNECDKEELSFFRETKSGRNSREEEKMSSLRRACMVEKWMEKKVSDKVLKKSSNKTLLEEFDVQDMVFFSTTSTSTSSSSELDYSGYGHSRPRDKSKSRVPACFAPPMPKPVRTRPIEVESKFLEHFEEDKNSHYNSKQFQGKFSKSKAVSIYSNLKSLKQPVSPGVRLTTFINSLFTKDNNGSTNKKNRNKNNNKSSRSNNNNVGNSEKIVPTSYSACTTPSSYSRSCLSSKNNKKIHDDHGVKRTVRFCPVSVIVDEDSRPCGHRSLFKESDQKMISPSKFARSLSKRYEELRILNGFEKENCDKIDDHQKRLEEVALDLLSGYWDSRLSNKSHHHECGKDIVNDGNYGDNHGGNYDQREDFHDDDDGDRWSCSSSDLFELDHLSLIGNELPVYETTQFVPKIL